jgi:C4-dicarboxylate-specific signal transduction histidine kinase
VSDTKKTIFTQEYSNFVYASGKYFGGFCVFSLILASYACVIGEATIKSPLLIAGIVVYNVSLTQIFIRKPFLSDLRYEILFRQLPNFIFCPIAFFSLAPALSPWWPIYLTFCLAGTVATGFTCPTRFIPRLFVLFWAANFLIGAWIANSHMNFYQMAYLVGGICMVGFVSIDWMQTAKASIEKERDVTAELQTKNGQLLEVQEKLRASLEFEAEAKLEAVRSQKIMQRAQMIARLGVWQFDVDSEVAVWSDELFRIFGLSPGMTPKTFLEIFARVHPADQMALKTAFERLENLGEPYDIHYRMNNYQSQMVHLHSSVDVEKDENGTAKRALGVIRDVTEQMKSNRMIEQQQIQLIASGKLSALGEMAAGIAHEINTPLGALLMNAEMIQTKLVVTPIDIADMTTRLDSIISISQRISKIVIGLKLFSRNAPEDKKTTVSLSALVESTLDLCRERFKNHGVELIIKDIPGDFQVCGHTVQLSQALLNLLNNSYDAVVSKPEKWIKIEVQLVNERLHLSVEDSGNGIAEKDLENIFNPFFTTKDVGSGTGLGLSISKGIMKNHNGDLKYDGTGQNTKFTMSFPGGELAAKKSSEQKAS